MGKLNNMKKILFICSIATIITSCKPGDDAAYATGTFESKEIIVSTGVGGQILKLDVEEGMILDANTMVGYVDTAQLYLKKLQLRAQINAVLSRQPDIKSQLAAIQEQIKTANTEKARATNLLNAGVATQKQLDDINAQILVLQKQLDAQQKGLEITSSSIYNEVNPLTYQIAQIDDQLNQAMITNPVKGTVLTKYAEQGEFTAPGKAIYKIADLQTMTLRAYISGTQLGGLQLGQKVNINVDSETDAMKTVEGTVYWISDKAEFTPKTIQTKDERANLVYAIKIRVVNDGSIKIGMYGEVDLPQLNQ